MAESLADRARAAAIARWEHQPTPWRGPDTAQRRTLRVSGSIKYHQIPLLNHQLSRVLGEQVGFTWDWNVPVRAVSDQELVPADPHVACLFLRTRVEDVYIEAHASQAEPDVFDFFVDSGIAWGPLVSIDDLGEHLLLRSHHGHNYA